MAAITPTIKSGAKFEVHNNLLLAFIPPAKCIGIKLDYQKPESFESAEEKSQWEENAQKDAEELKVKLEAGTIKLDAIKDRIVVNPPRAKIHRGAANRFISQMIEQEDALLIERDFIKLSQQLRDCLGLKRADVDRCLDILKQYKEFQLTKLMLLRNPDCVDSIRRLRRYIGNLKLWNLTEEQETDFKAKAEIIRYEAVLIYNNFKKIFGPNTSTHFWEEFCNQVQVYKEKTKHLNDQARLILTEKVYNTLNANKQTKGTDSDGIEDEKLQAHKPGEPENKTVLKGNVEEMEDSITKSEDADATAPNASETVAAISDVAVEAN